MDLHWCLSPITELAYQLVLQPKISYLAFQSFLFHKKHENNPPEKAVNKIK